MLEAIVTSVAPISPPRYIMLGYLRGLFDYLRARSRPLGPVLEPLGLTEDQLRDPDIRVDHALQDEIFAVSELLTGDPNVGLHAGEATHLMHFGILGQMVMTCETVRDLVELHSRFQKLISTGATITYREVGNEVMGEATFEDGARPSRHTIEYTLGSHTTLARLMTGVSVVLSRVEVTYASPDDPSEQERVFGCPIEYGCERERFFFPLALLDAPVVMGDSASRRVLEVEARRRLDAVVSPRIADDSALAELRPFIEARLHRGAPDIRSAAATLGLSVRSLQRRLERVRLSYREVIDLVRREAADRYLRHGSHPQIEVAFLLGYSDQSTFHRAFRRWFGISPGEYRKLSRPDRDSRAARSADSPRRGSGSSPPRTLRTP